MCESDTQQKKTNKNGRIGRWLSYSPSRLECWLQYSAARSLHISRAMWSGLSIDFVRCQDIYTSTSNLKKANVPRPQYKLQFFYDGRILKEYLDSKIPGNSENTNSDDMIQYRHSLENRKLHSIQYLALAWRIMFTSIRDRTTRSGRSARFYWHTLPTNVTFHQQIMNWILLSRFQIIPIIPVVCGIL